MHGAYDELFPLLNFYSPVAKVIQIHNKLLPKINKTNVLRITYALSVVSHIHTTLTGPTFLFRNCGRNGTNTECDRFRLSLEDGYFRLDNANPLLSIIFNIEKTFDDQRYRRILKEIFLPLYYPFVVVVTELVKKI